MQIDDLFTTAQGRKERGVQREGQRRSAFMASEGFIFK